MSPRIPFLCVDREHGHRSRAAQMVCRMHQSYGHPGDMAAINLRHLRSELILEEAHEASDVLEFADMGSREQRAALLKELADILVVTYGAADVYRLPLDPAMIRVHMSNLSKIMPDGTVERRADGKILKGPNYHAPNLSDLV